MVEYSVSEVSDPVQGRRDRMSLPQWPWTASKYEAEIFPENILELCIEERAPEPKCQLCYQFVWCRELVSPSQLGFGVRDFLVLPAKSRNTNPYLPPVCAPVQSAQLSVDTIA